MTLYTWDQLFPWKPWNDPETPANAAAHTIADAIHEIVCELCFQMQWWIEEE